MRKTLEDLYYGNIIPNEQRMTPGSEMEKAIACVTSCRTEQFGAGLSDSTVRGCHVTCRAALEKAVQEGLLRSNPTAGCKLPPKRGREMQVLGREELQRFLLQA